MDIPFGKFIEPHLADHHVIAATLHVVRNVIFGGVAAPLLWLADDPQATSSTSRVTPFLLVASLLVGGGGVQLLGQWFRQKTEEATSNALGRATSDLAQRVLPTVDTESTGRVKGEPHVEGEPDEDT